jgi:hypothetical protein
MVSFKFQVGVRRTAFIPGSGANSIASLETLRSRATIKSEYVHSAQARIPWFNERKKIQTYLFLPMFLYPYPPIEKMAESWCYFRFLIASNSYALAVLWTGLSIISRHLVRFLQMFTYSCDVKLVAFVYC